MFQPTPTHGGRLTSASLMMMSRLFQPTPTHGGRRSHSILSHMADICFNPRPRTVGDRRSRPPSHRLVGFQPTPTHGGRLSCASSLELSCGFQPTPTHGGRQKIVPGSKAGDSVSTHAHARWATLLHDAKEHGETLFQPTPTHGGRPFIRGEGVAQTAFQPTPTHGGRPRGRFEGSSATLFQPTPTHGGRLTKQVVALLIGFVSTHAHARWATNGSGTI